MLDALKQVIAHQFEAALCTLSRCIDRCPDELWNARVGNLAFCQVAFHTLFFADYYLETDEARFREQPFHRENPEFFRDYEELQDRAQVLMYDKPSVQKYVRHVRTKAAQAIAADTAETLSAPCGFAGRTFSRAELYVYNLRHIQHHAAQLSLRLRLDAKVEIPWIGSGWREA
jgi:hypothetical protein